LFGPTRSRTTSIFIGGSRAIAPKSRVRLEEFLRGYGTRVDCAWWMIALQSHLMARSCSPRDRSFPGAGKMALWTKVDTHHPGASLTAGTNGAINPATDPPLPTYHPISREGPSKLRGFRRVLLVALLVGSSRW
jgi:hypothetical protein